MATAIGKVIVLFGTVKAVAPDGTERVLEPNSIVYANERIITESDGSVSIVLDGPPPTQVDLGRMSDVLLDEDVYAAGPAVADTMDMMAEAERLLEALESDEDIEIDATAAGAGGGAGGGVTLVKFDADGNEILPDSGAETEGVSFGTTGTIEGPTVPPIGGADDALTNEDYLEFGNIGGPGSQGENFFAEGFLAYSFGTAPPATVNPFVWNTAGLPDIESQGNALQYEVVNGGLTVNAYYIGDGGRVDVFTLEVTNVDTGAYRFELLQPLDHSEPGIEDNIIFNFTYTLTNSYGLTGTGSLAVTVNDDSPVLLHQELPDPAVEGWWAAKHGLAEVSGTIEDNVSWGADGFGGATMLTVGDDVFDIPQGEGITVYWDQEGKFLGTMEEYNDESGPYNNGEVFLRAESYNGTPFISEGPVLGASLTVNSDGTYTFTLLNNMLLGQGEQGRQIDTLATVAITGVDGDGDPIDVDVTLRVQDDIPCCITIPEFAFVAEDKLLPDGSGGYWPYSYEAEGTIVNNAYWGADGFGVVTGFTVGEETFEAGTKVYWDQYGNLLPENGGQEDSYNGMALMAIAPPPSDDFGPENPEGAAAMLVVNSDGTYTFTLLSNMLLGQGVQGKQLNLLDKVTIHAQDGDGDKVNIDLYLKVQDDVPNITLTALDELEESASLLTYDEHTIGTAYGTDSANFSGAFVYDPPKYGADGPAPGETAPAMNYYLSLANWKVKDSGLKSGGETVNLYKVGDSIVGSTAKTWFGRGDESKWVFKVDVDGAGEVTLTQFQAIDHTLEQGPENLPYSGDVEYLGGNLVVLWAKATITDADGDKASDWAKFDLGGYIGFADDGPVANDSSPPLSFTLNVTNYGETSAGYNNSFGYYIKDSDGNPTEGMVIWHNVKEFEEGQISLTGYTPDQVGFFIIPDGERENSGLEPNTEVEFRYEDGQWQAYAGDVKLLGKNPNANILFDNPELNPDGGTYVVDNDFPGNLNWEDIYGNSSDWDYNDVNIGVEWSGSATGNVLDNDYIGADGGSVTAIKGIDLVDGTGTAIGQGGTLVINSDGEYTYTFGMVAPPIEVTVSVPGDDNAELIWNGEAGFGIRSKFDGDHPRFGEINYLGNGESEEMIFALKEGWYAAKATVEVTLFFNNGSETERGYYKLYKNGEFVQDSYTEFNANSADGNYTLTIEGPEGGFDQIVFGALQDLTQGEDDDSDYSIASVTFEGLSVSEVFTYKVTDGDGDWDTADLTIDIDNTGLDSLVGPEDVFGS